MDGQDGEDDIYALRRKGRRIAVLDLDSDDDSDDELDLTAKQSHTRESGKAAVESSLGKSVKRDTLKNEISDVEGAPKGRSWRSRLRDSIESTNTTGSIDSEDIALALYSSDDEDLEVQKSKGAKAFKEQPKEDLTALSDSDDSDSDVEVDAEKVYSHPLIREQLEFSENLKKRMLMPKDNPPQKSRRCLADDDDELDEEEINRLVQEGLTKFRERYHTVDSNELTEKYLNAGRESLAKMAAAASASSSSSSSSLGVTASAITDPIRVKFKYNIKGKTVEKVLVCSSSAPIGPIFTKFCTEELEGIDRSKVSFVFDGETLNDNFKPQDEDLEDDDQIDVHVKP
mmetsp:Transcript_21754/g.42792  ORF Transcript_21754/g.42792 Transcript_21754/m.42792 type:complete len:343 (+) Transcript_21754:155-1183(+)